MHYQAPGLLYGTKEKEETQPYISMLSLVSRDVAFYVTIKVMIAHHKVQCDGVKLRTCPSGISKT